MNWIIQIYILRQLFLFINKTSKNNKGCTDVDNSGKQQHFDRKKLNVCFKDGNIFCLFKTEQNFQASFLLCIKNF